MLMLISLMSFSLLLDVSLGLDPKPSLYNEFNPFLVMEFIELVVCLSFIAFLFKTPLLTFYNKRKGKKKNDPSSSVSTES
ncbi:hypothetical protein [Jeotgalibacillus soli]|nr:hypothetical protein [Jeotgalibacillus soli]